MAASPQHPQTRRGDDGQSSGIGALHRDALYEILLRVPSQPLCRFRSVCRSWRSLLSGPSSFVAAHVARHRDQPLLAVCGLVRGSDYKTAEIKLVDTSGRVVKRFDAGPSWLLRRVWPQHDLVLIVSRLDGADHRPRLLRVLDPATGVVSVLPGGYNNNETHNRSSFVFGRAAASSTGPGDDGAYKVLSITTRYRFYYGTPQFCKILTVVDGGGGRWRDAPAPPVAIKTFHRAETVVASGVVYHLVDSSNGWRIAAFDLDAEQWLPDLLHGPVEPPSSIDQTTECRSLAEVNRRLAAVYSTSSAMELCLLMGSQWCKRCRVVTSSIEWHYRLMAEPVPLWVLDDGRVAFWMRNCLSKSASLWMYDPRTETCARLASCLRIGANGYTGNLLRQQAQYAQASRDGSEKP